MKDFETRDRERMSFLPRGKATAWMSSAGKTAMLMVDPGREEPV